MTKQYKHKISGDIAYLDTIFYRLKDQAAAIIPAYIVEKGDDWQEVKEEKPAYTILSFRALENGANPGKVCFELHSNGRYAGWCTLESMLANNMAGNKEIYSVRRESDGEVFTVGDIVKTWQGEQEIKQIYIIGANDLRFWLTNNWSFNGKPEASGFTLTYIEKVKPKEWEITALKAIGGTHILTPDSVSFRPNKELILSKEKNVFYEIYTVKRLSDGVEFKIGDKVKYKGDKGIFTIDHFQMYNKNTQYEGFEAWIKEWELAEEGSDLNLFVKVEKLFTTEDGVDIYEDDVFFTVDKKTLFFLRNGFVAKGAVKPNNNTTSYFSTKAAAEAYIAANKPKPLFTTDDGKQIFKGDKVTALNTENIVWRVGHTFTVDESHKRNKENTQSNHILWFSSPQAAEQYILYNKPCLSINDVAKVYITANQQPDSEGYMRQQPRDLLNLVKNKLNL